MNRVQTTTQSMLTRLRQKGLVYQRQRVLPAKCPVQSLIRNLWVQSSMVSPTLFVGGGDTAMSTAAVSASAVGRKKKKKILLSSHLHRTFKSTKTMASAEFDRIKAQGSYGSYTEEYSSSIQDPETFWKKAADLVEWHKKPTSILSMPNPNKPWLSSWYSDGMINMAYNCLDVHVQGGRGDQDALIYDSPVTGVKARYTYKELLHEVSALASVLTDLGVAPGDRVVIYMPMMPESIVSMLACSRIGAIHSVVFGGFAPKELATRISDCQPKVVLAASVGVEPTRLIPYKPLLEEALKLASPKHIVQNTIILQRENVQRCEMGPKDLDYNELMTAKKSSMASSPHDAVPLPASHYHHILYTSGTTGIPKGVIRETGGWVVALKYAMGSFYDTHPGELYWSASDIGWAVGHLAVYAPLLQGCTTIVYEGKPVGTPDAGAFWRVIEECTYIYRKMYVMLDNWLGRSHVFLDFFCPI